MNPSQSNEPVLSEQEARLRSELTGLCAANSPLFAELGLREPDIIGAGRMVNKIKKGLELLLKKGLELLQPSSPRQTMVYVAVSPGRPDAAWAACVDHPRRAKETLSHIASWLKKDATLMYVSLDVAKQMTRNWERYVAESMT